MHPVAGALKIAIYYPLLVHSRRHTDFPCYYEDCVAVQVSESVMRKKTEMMLQMMLIDEIEHFGAVVVVESAVADGEIEPAAAAASLAQGDEDMVMLLEAHLMMMMTVVMIAFGIGDDSVHWYAAKFDERYRALMVKCHGIDDNQTESLLLMKMVDAFYCVGEIGCGCSPAHSV